MGLTEAISELASKDLDLSPAIVDLGFKGLDSKERGTPSELGPVPLQDMIYLLLSKTHALTTAVVTLAQVVEEMGGEAPSRGDSVD